MQSSFDTDSVWFYKNSCVLTVKKQTRIKFEFFLESLQLQIFERTKENANFQKNERKSKYSKKRKKTQIFERTRKNANFRKNERKCKYSKEWVCENVLFYCNSKYMTKVNVKCWLAKFIVVLKQNVKNCVIWICYDHLFMKNNLRTKLLFIFFPTFVCFRETSSAFQKKTVYDNAQNFPWLLCAWNVTFMVNCFYFCICKVENLLFCWCSRYSQM